MLMFLLGVSITINVILFILLVIIIKFHKFLRYFSGTKDDEIVDMDVFEDFMECDKL